MSAVYSTSDYLGFFLACLIGSILVLFTLYLVIIFRFRKTRIVIPAFLLFIIFIVGIFSCSIPIITQLGDLLIPGEYELRNTGGVIQSIKPADHAPPHWVNGRLCDAVSVELGGQQFYVISEGMLSPGMTVELQYAAFENNVILSWKEASPERIEQVLQEQAFLDAQPKPEPPTVEVSPTQIKLGTLLVRLGFLGFFIHFAVCHLFEGKLTVARLRRDLQVHNQIRPDKKAFMFSLLPLFCIGLAVTGFSVGSGQLQGFHVLAMGGGGMLMILFTQVSTSLKLDGQYVILKKRGKEVQYPIQDIISLRWKPHNKGTGKILEIIFADRSLYSFDTDNYLGTQNVYDTLRKRMSAQE